AGSASASSCTPSPIRPRESGVARPLRFRQTMNERRLPLWVKLGYTAFMVVLVPCYWHLYGPTNFLYFCDLSLLHAGGGLDGKLAARVDAGGGHPPAAGVLDGRLPLDRRGSADFGSDQ